MNPLIIVLALVTFFSTLIGGIVILRFKKGLPYVFGFAAGSLMGVAFLDILPESLEIAAAVNIPVRYIMITVVLSFFFYHTVERFFVTHPMDISEGHAHIMGPIGAGSLVVHSLLDGVAIGAAFHVNSSLGFIIALAVIFHDFTDGINTVTIMLKNNQQKSRAFLFLFMDALAPVIGVITVSLITLPESILAFILAVFVGEFIYIGAANLLPESQKYPSKKTLIAIATGVFLIMVLTSFI